MADNFDLDDLLDDVLDSTVPVSANNLLDELADELLGPSTSVPIQKELKYPELSFIPEELQQEWETLISRDEALMKGRKGKKLSDTYLSRKSEVQDMTLQSFFSMLLQSVLTNRENSDILIEKMTHDEKLILLFKEELRKKARFCIDKSDRDIIKGDFPHIKSISGM